MTVLHSFAVMAYRDSPYLVDCMDSLKSQTITSEIYISTSTPSDYIREIAQQYEVKLFIAESGQGIAHDWNFALQHAKTKYMTLAHQDDVYLPEYTALCIEAAEKFSDTLICFTGYSEIVGGVERSDKILLKIKRFMLRLFMPMTDNLRHTLRKKALISLGNPIAAPSVMYHPGKLKGFLFSSTLSVNMDWDAWYRMAGMGGRFVYVNKTLMKHRIHPGSATSQGLEANLRQKEDLMMFHRFWPGFLAKIIAKLYARSYKSNRE